MRKQPQIYKSFLIIPRGDKIQIFDIAGKVYAEADSIADAQEMISEHVSSIVRARKEKKPEKRTYKHLLDNPRDKKKFGYDWDDIQAMQRGTYVRPKIDLSKSGKKAATDADVELLKKYGREGLESEGMFGVLDRLKNSGMIDNPPRKKTGTSKLLTVKCLHKGCGFETPYYSDQIYFPHYCMKCGRPILVPEKKNPPLTKIYDCIKEVIAVKGPGHKCDAACKRANHTYRHVFTKKHGIFGTADGQKLIIE